MNDIVHSLLQCESAQHPSDMSAHLVALHSCHGTFQGVLADRVRAYGCRFGREWLQSACKWSDLGTYSSCTVTAFHAAKMAHGVMYLPILRTISLLRRVVPLWVCTTGASTSVTAWRTAWVTPSPTLMAIEHSSTWLAWRACPLRLCCFVRSHAYASACGFGICSFS